MPRCSFCIVFVISSGFGGPVDMVPLAGPRKIFRFMLHERSAQQNKKPKRGQKKRRLHIPKKRMAEKIGRHMFVTTDDGKKLTAGSMVAIHEVVERFVASTVAEMSYVVKRDFERIFVTSDVHADLRKFVEILVSLGLVTENSGNSGTENENKHRNRGDIVWDLEWNADDTMLMITGDLIDGKRGHRMVEDPRGSYEMLLHILLFNRRIGARARNSEVLFVIGNHDMYRASSGTKPRGGRLVARVTLRSLRQDPMSRGFNERPCSRRSTCAPRTSWLGVVRTRRATRQETRD